MKVHRIHIEQQMMQLGIDSQNAGISIETTVRRMKVNNKDAEMTVEREAPDVDIDLRDFRNNNGIKDIATFMKEYTAKAYQHISQTIKQYAENGDYVATLPNSGNPIGQLARNKLLAVNTPQMNSGQVPYGAVKMKGDVGDFNIDWTRHDLKIEWDEYQAPQITLEPKPSVNIYVQQEPYIEFTVVEETIPAEKGVALDDEA